MKLKPEDMNASSLTGKVKEEVAKEASKEINKSLGIDKK